MNKQIIEYLQNNPKEARILLNSSLKDYIKVIHYYLYNREYIFKDFHIKIINYLEKYIFNKKATKHLIINIPVRCGKSMLVTYFISWLLSINKRNNVIYTSYDASLTLKYSTIIRDFITTDFYKSIFNQYISPNTKAKDEWKILNGGEFIAKSMSSGITGRGADYIIIDDPMKAGEERSNTIRENVIETYKNTLKSRLDNKNTGRIILIQQRLNVNDLTGYLLENEKDDWDIIKIPALDDNNKSIFEEKLPTEFLLKEKEINNYVFQAQYQQEPILAGGNIIKQEWFKNYDILPKLKSIYITGDTAFKTKESNDYSVFQLWGKTEFSNNSDYYLIDMIRGKWESPELLNTLLNFYTKWKVKLNVNCLYIEDKASGIGLIQQIQRLKIPVKEVKKDKDKYTCLMDVLPKIASGYVYIPTIAEWKNDFINECCEFSQDNSHKHDDIVDCLVMGINDYQITLRDIL